MFWDTFLATLWGALAGAVVGAAASWAFALDLRRRDAIDWKRRSAEEREDRSRERVEFARLESRFLLARRARPALREIAEQMTELAVADSTHGERVHRAVSSALTDLSDQLEGEEHDMVAALHHFVEWPRTDADVLAVWVKLELYLVGQCEPEVVRATARAHSRSMDDTIAEMKSLFQGGRLTPRRSPWPLETETPSMPSVEVDRS